MPPWARDPKQTQRDAWGLAAASELKEEGRAEAAGGGEGTAGRPGPSRCRTQLGLAQTHVVPMAPALRAFHPYTHSN